MRWKQIILNCDTWALLFRKTARTRKYSYPCWKYIVEFTLYIDLQPRIYDMEYILCIGYCIFFPLIFVFQAWKKFLMIHTISVDRFLIIPMIHIYCDYETFTHHYFFTYLLSIGDTYRS